MGYNACNYKYLRQPTAGNSESYGYLGQTHEKGSLRKDRPRERRYGHPDEDQSASRFRLLAVILSFLSIMVMARVVIAVMARIEVVEDYPD